MALWRGLECGSKAAATKLNKATKRIKIKYARRNETPRGGVERFARERHSHRGMAFAYFAFYKRYGILQYCMQARVHGIICFGMGLTLRGGNREYFYGKLEQSFPRLKEKYQRIYGDNYIVSSPAHAKLMRIFHETCERERIMHDNEAVFSYLHTFEEKQKFEQMKLF